MIASTFETIIKSASTLIEAGFNVIPVRDKDEVSGEKIFPKKSPFYGWKKWQTERIAVSQFFELLEKSKSTWIAIVLGEISNRTICVDIDNKHWLGVEHKLFNALENIYPHIWQKLRIHKSQSGGYHIFFSVPDGMDIIRSKKLAYKDGEKEAGIELKGEGGIVVIPPSEGYSIVKDNPIPRLSEQEISIIFAIIEDINEKRIVKKEKVNRSNFEDNYYSVNPFDDFNHSQKGAFILEDFGWKAEGENSQFIHFTRPGKKGGISATFIKDKFCFHIFTSSDNDLEANVNYSPCAVVQQLNNLSSKDLYKWLIDNGFGKADPKKEIKRARKMANHKVQPLNNFSQEAAQVFNEAKKEVEQKLPFGQFWKYNQRGEPIISRAKIITIANSLGFRLYNDDLVKIVDDKFIYNQNEREFQDAIKDYVYTNEEGDYDDIIDCLEAFFQKSTTYIITRLEFINTHSILKDSKTEAYKFFKNTAVLVTKDSIQEISYKEIDHYIHNDQIIKRDFVLSAPIPSGKYSQFLDLSCGLDDYTKKIIGFLSHLFKDETTGYIITLTEKVINPKNGGGSGKNIFCNLFKQITTVCNTNGAQLNYDERFLQSWNRERIMSLSDVPKDFPFSFLKEGATGTMKWRRLFHNGVDVEVEDTPKFVIQTNYSFEVTDGGVGRRVIPLEFSDFFTKSGGVDKHFDCHFPNGWSSDDWVDFDNLILESIQLWIKAGCKLDPRELSDSGWKKQFEMNYGSVITGLVDEYLQSWVDQKEIEIDKINADILDYYNQSDINIRFRPSRKRINEAIDEWCKMHNVTFNKSAARRINSVVFRVYKFVKAGDSAEVEQAPDYDDSLPF